MPSFACLSADLPTVPLLAGQAKSWKCPAFCKKSDFFVRAQFVTLSRCLDVGLMQITQLNVITEIPFDFSQKYQTVPRPNRRATVNFGTQLISVGCIGLLLKKSQCGPCQPSAFCRQVPLFYAKCPSKNILQVGRSALRSQLSIKSAGMLFSATVEDIVTFL